MKEISKPLVKWYQQNKRDLPWREDKNPYHVWISEIMLQQTRIEAVKKYYTRFMNTLPTIESLANIEEEKLLKLWEGLGYYNRAHNLQKAAIMIMEKHQGIFPTTYEKIIKLPGIGEYTAGAISSICFNEKQVAVDGNVLRVFMRLSNCNDNVLDEKVKTRVANSLRQILPDEVGDFNEGLMELGEVICLPTQPQCYNCPLCSFCKAHQLNNENNLPVRIKKDLKKEENLTVFLLYYQDKIALSYRGQKGLLRNLWEFPNVEKKLSLNEINQWLKRNSLEGSICKSITNRHIFTHKIWNMTSYLIKVNQYNSNYTWVSVNEAKEKYAIPTAFQPFLKILETIDL